MKKVIVITGESDGSGMTLAETLSPTNEVIILSPTETKLKEVGKLIEFIIALPNDVVIPKVGIKNIYN